MSGHADVTAISATQVTQYFPQGERSAAFKWKDYSPQVFQRLRGIFGIDNKARSSFRSCANKLGLAWDEWDVCFGSGSLPI